MKSTPDYYLCPFCVSSWVCHGPHIEEKDMEKFLFKVQILKEDLAEYSKELVLKHGSSMTIEELASLIQAKLLSR
jgi:hypothetical protein